MIFFFKEQQIGFLCTLHGYKRRIRLWKKRSGIPQRNIMRKQTRTKIRAMSRKRRRPWNFAQQLSTKRYLTEERNYQSILTAMIFWQHCIIIRYWFTWRNWLGYPAHTGLISLSVRLSVSPSVCLEYEKTWILNEGIKIRVSTWSFLSIVHPLRITIPMCEKKIWVQQENSYKITYCLRVFPT